MLQRDIKVGQYQAICHQWNQFVDMRVGVDIVQTDPGTELAELTTKFSNAGFNRFPTPEIMSVFKINPVGGGVLGYDQ